MPSGTKRRYSQVSNGGHTDHSGQASQSETHGTTNNTNTNNTVSAGTGQTAPGQRATCERRAKRPRKQRRRKNEPEEDYSQIAREKTHNSGRTRQACDRCQARKLKCDKNPTGCGKCAQANLHCFSTDRTTGITFQRGQMERLQVENQQLRVENGQLRQRLLDTTQQAETMHGMLQQLGFQPPMINPPSQAGQTNAQQSSQLLMQPVPPGHPSQQGGNLQGQGQGQGYTNSPWAPSAPCHQNTQTTPITMNMQYQQPTPRRRSSTQQQRHHVSQQYPTRQGTLHQSQEEERQRQSLLHLQQVSPQVFQERSQAQASNMSYPPNDGGDFTYPIQPQPAASVHYDSRPSLSQMSGANAMPGSLPRSVAHSEPGGFLHDYTPSSGLMGLGQDQVNTGGQNGIFGDDGGTYLSPSAQGLASDSTVLTSTWTMDGKPPQNSGGTQQTHDSNNAHAQQQTHGTASHQQQVYDNQPIQDANQTRQAYHGRQTYDLQQLQAPNQQQYPEQTAYGRQACDSRLSPRHEQQQTYDSQQQQRHEEIQQHETFLRQSNQDRDQLLGQPVTFPEQISDHHDTDNDNHNNGSDAVITNTTTGTSTSTGATSSIDPSTTNAGVDSTGNDSIDGNNGGPFPDPAELDPSLLASLGISIHNN